MLAFVYEIASMDRQLPDIMDTPFNNIQYRAGGLNHFRYFSRIKIQGQWERCISVNKGKGTALSLKTT